MRSLKLGTFAGIPVKLHWTFFLLVLFIAYVAFSESLSGQHTLWFGLYVLTLFFCVVLHEYGHALAARYYGVKTRDIVLSPIGGVARLEKLPEKPFQELVIAFAGPLVNIVIALIVSMLLFMVADGSISLEDADILSIDGSQEFWLFVLILNLALFFFNLIPAFPMDGGRVLRSLLAMRWGRVRATRWASIVGRTLAVGFVIFGLMYQLYLLAFIGVFIFLSASAEYNYARLSEKFEEYTASDIMRTNFTLLSPNDSFHLPIDHFRRTGESHFIIINDEAKPMGSLPYAFIQEAEKEGLDTYPTVAGLMSSKFLLVEEATSLRHIYEKMNEMGLTIVGVTDAGGKISGVIDRDGMKRLLENRG